MSLIHALFRTPYGWVSVCAGTVTILGTLGILSAPIAGVVQGLLTVTLGICVATASTAANHAIQRRAVVRAVNLTEHKEL